jgi:hypothetical protein
MKEINISQIEKMIFSIRGMKVMLDSDLAELYGVETKALNRAVKRNLSRFPLDFMFELNSDDLSDLRRQFGTANFDFKRRYSPYVFTENGVAMLSGILNSERAISVNISIMRTFTQIRSIINNDQIISDRIQELEKNSDQLFKIVFDHLEVMNQEISKLRNELPSLPDKRKRIGLK